MKLAAIHETNQSIKNIINQITFFRCIVKLRTKFNFGII